MRRPARTGVVLAVRVLEDGLAQRGEARSGEAASASNALVAAAGGGCTNGSTCVQTVPLAGRASVPM